MAACSRNPLGEDLTQTIVNLGFRVTYSCSTSLNQDTPFTCAFQADDSTIANIVYSIQTGTTCTWASINSTSGVVTGTPNDNQVGNCNLIIGAENTERRGLNLVVPVVVQNVAPIFTPIANPGSIAEDSALSVIRTGAQVTTTEEGFGNYGFATATAPRCSDNALVLTIDASTGAISYRPALNYFGTCYIRASFDDGNGQPNSVVTSEFSITVTPVNDAPVLALIPDQTIFEGGVATVPVIVSDVDNALVCSAVSLTVTSSNTTLVNASAMALSGTIPNCVLTVTPLSLQNGVTTITVVASDGTLSATDAFDLTVVAVPDPPVLAPVANQMGTEDTNQVFSINITDPDTVLACNSSFVSATSSNAAMLPISNIVISGAPPNCTVTLTPVANMNGVSNIVLSLTDGTTTVSQTFAANFAAVNDPPVITGIANQTIAEDAIASVNFSISDVDNTLNCAASVSANSSNLALIPVSNIVITGTAPNCVAMMTPLANQNGISNINLTVTDGSLSASSPFSLMVTPVNDAPQISVITNQTTSEDTAAAVNFTITDVDNVLACNVSVSATSSNGSLVPAFNIVFTGTAPNCMATLTPLANQNGATNIVLTATDGSLTANSPFILTVTAVNDAPVISAIANQTTNEDTATAAIGFTITDIDSFLICSSANLNVTSSNVGLVPTANIVISGTAPNCFLTITPIADQFGTTNFVATVSDNGAPNLQATSSFSLTVNPINDAPVISAVTAQITSESISRVVNFTITDVESALSCTASVSATSSNVTLVPAGNIVFGGTAPNCTATVNPTANQNGVSNLAFTVTDTLLTASNSFSFTVTPVDDPPVISLIADQSNLEDTAQIVNFTITDIDSVLSCTTSVVASSSNAILLNAPTQIVFGGTAPNCTATLNPALNQNGITNIVFALSDATSSVTEPFIFTVTAVNDAPVISIITNQTTAEDTSAGAIAFTITDVDNVLTCAASVTATSSNAALLPVGNIVLAGTAPNCTVTMTPVLNQNGVSNVVLTVTDGILSATSPYSLTVTAVNDAPVISAIANQSTAEDTVTGAVAFTITDVDNVLTCGTSVTATSSSPTLLPVGNIVLGGTAPNCTVTMTPALNQSGISNVVLTVTDGLLSATSAYSLTVTAVNDAPVISAFANQITAEDTATGAIAFTITDVDNVLTCTSSVSATSSNTALLPTANIVINGTAPNCTVTMTPALNQNGISNVVLTVNDGSLATLSSYSLTVTAVNDVPVISAITNQTVAESGTITVPFTVTDVDNTLSCLTSVTASSSNLTLLPVANIVLAGTAPNCTATLNPVVNQNGLSNIVLTLSDGSIAVTSPFTLTVTAFDDPPTISAIADTTVTEDNSVVLSFTINDIDSVLNCTTSMSKSSSNLILLPLANIVFAGTAPNCTATLNPALNQNGISNLVFTVSDATSSVPEPLIYTVTAVNDAPVISAIANQTINEDGTTGATAFTITDVDNTLNCSTSNSVMSSNLSLLPLANIVLAGTAPNCTVTMAPVANQSGISNVVITTTDGALTATSAFSLTVNAVNDAPIMSTIANQTTAEDTATAAIGFTISDVDSLLLCTSANLSVTSSNGTLLPTANIVFGGAAPNCTVTMSPAADQNGISNVVVTVFDNGTPNLQVTSAFTLTVTPVNDAPLISAVANQTIAEDGATGAVAFTITDVDNTLVCSTFVSATTSNAGLLPVGNIVLSGTAPNCTVTMTPLANQFGVSNIVLTVNDGAITASSTFTLTVNAVNDAPVISTIANQTTFEGVDEIINFAVSDIDNVLSCTASLSATSSNTTVIPTANIVFSGTAPNCVATISPAALQNGVSSIVISVTDGALSAASSFTQTVTPIDDPPVISAIADQVTNEDVSVVINFTITDPDSVLSCATSMSATSSNVVLVPVSAIVFSGTAPNCTATVTSALNASGLSNLVFTVNDGFTAVNEPLSYTVTAVNDAPVISSITNQTTAEDTATGAVAFIITDVDNTLTCGTSVTATSSNATLLPTGNIVLAGTAPKCTVTMTSALNQNGVSNIVLTVTDGTTSATSAYSLTVTAVNDVPVISAITNQTTAEDTATGAVAFTITDVDNTLTCGTSVTATSSNTTLLPTGNIVLAGTAPNCTVTMAPALNQSGVSNVVLTVFDGALTATTSFNLTVTAVNDAPVISAITNQTTAEDTATGAVAFTITDVDNTLTCAASVSATSSNVSVLPVGNIAIAGTAPNCTVTMTPLANQNGITNITLTVTDGALAATSSYSLIVTAVNDAPIISAIGNQTTAEDTATGAIAFTITDIDNALVCSSANLTATSSNMALLPVANIVFSGTAPNCTVVLTPALNQNGVSNIVITVADNGTPNLQASAPFSYTVTAVNDAPVISAITNQTTAEDTATGAVAFTISDVDNTLTCTTSVTATSSNTTLLPVGNIAIGGTAPNCTVTMTPALNENGVSNIVLTVTDGVLANTSAYSLTVTAVNDLPVISAVANQTTAEDTATAAIAFTISDVDNTLTCAGSVSTSSSNTTLLPIGNIAIAGTAPNCTVTMNPALNQNGLTNIVLTVTDGSLSATSPFSLTVTPVNDAPVISVIANQTTAEDTPTAAIAFTITDVDNTLNCTTSVSKTSTNTAMLPVANISLAGTAPNCTVTMNPVLNENGTSNIVLTVTDGALTATSPFTLTVTAVNDAPVISAIADQTINEETSTAPIAFTVTDVDSTLNCGTALSATSSNATLLPLSGIVFGGTAPNCTVALTPATNQNGNSNVVISIFDGALAATSAFTLTVIPVNDPPVISAIANQTTNEDTATAAIPFTITDPDNALVCSSVNLSVTSSNVSLLPIANIVIGGTAPNCTVTMTPALDQNGITNIVLTVTDGLLTASSAFSLTVNAVNDAPVISGILDQTTVEDTDDIVTFTITDVDSVLLCTSANLSATSSVGSLQPVANIVFTGTAPNCTATLSPALNQFGVSNIVLTVFDNGTPNLQATSPFLLTVTADNDQPMMSNITDATMLEDGTLIKNFTITDVDDVLNCVTSMSASSSNTTLLPDANIVFGGTAPNCTATISPAANRFGIVDILFTVADPPGSISNRFFTVTVTSVNDAPVISAITNQTTAEDTAFASIAFTISDVETAVSCTTSVTMTSTNTALIPVANVVFSGTAPNCNAVITPALNANGTSNLTFRVTDGVANSTSAFVATVTAVNDAPVISAIANQTANEDTVTGAIAFTITDVDSTLTCTASVSATSSNATLLPVANIVFAGTAPNCTVTMTPALNQNGISNVVLTVTDGTSSTTSPFSLTVVAVNDAPIISAIGNQTTNEDAVTGAIAFTITDVDNTLTCTASVSATSSNATLLPVANIIFSGAAPNCTVTMTPALNQNGVSNIVVTVSDGVASATRPFSLTVTAVNDAPVLSSIANQTLKTDSSVVLSYTLTDVDNTMDCSTSVTATSGTVTVIANADLTKGGTAPNCTLTVVPTLNLAGTSTISVTGSDGTASTTTTFVITTISVTSVAASPTPFSLVNAGDQEFLTATARYSNGTYANVTTNSNANWTSSAPATATVNNTTAKGVVTAVTGTGNVDITVSHKGQTGIANGTVYAMTGITVSRSVISGGINSVAAVTAQAILSPSGTTDITNVTTWTTSNTGVATVSGGVISLLAAGSATVTAAYGGYSQTVAVTVQNKTLTSIAVTPGTASMAVNATQNFVATATYSDASTQVVTAAANWTSANTGIADVSNAESFNGRATGIATGTTTITATIGAVSSNATLTINAATLVSIAVTPATELTSTNSKLQYLAVGTFSDASTSVITEQVTWASSDATAATISNSLGTRGLLSTLSFAGYKSSTISATLDSVTGSTPLSINGATISSVIITPAVTLTAGSTYQLKAWANLSDGGTVEVTSSAVWTSNTTAAITVSNGTGSKGLVTGVATGSAVITAAFGGASGTRTLSVAGAASVSEIGTGLTAEYFIWSGLSPPADPFNAANKRGHRIDAAVNFAIGGSGASPIGVTTMYSGRWTGFYKATSATNYFCTYSGDGVRLYINGVLVINNWTDHGPLYDCTANVPLTVGTKYSVEMHYYENGGNSQYHLLHSSLSAADASSTTKAIPQVDLYPQ